MRHFRIPKSNRHKKLKSIIDSNEDNFVYNEVKQKNICEQKMPQKWKEILESNKNFKQKNRRKKKKNNDLICVKSETETIEKGMTRSDKPLPQKLEQGLYESEYHFLQRLTKLSAKARAEATIEDRFDVDFCAKLDSNEESIDKDLKISHNNTSDNIPSNKQLRRKRKDIKRKIKNKNKKKNKKSDDLFKHLKDNIKFGETVSEPPLLTKFKFKKKPSNNLNHSLKPEFNS